MSIISLAQAAALGYRDIYITYPALGCQLLLLYAAHIRYMATGRKSLVGTTTPELFAETSFFCDVVEDVSALNVGTLFPSISAAGLRVFPLTYFSARTASDGKLHAGFSDRHLLESYCAGMGMQGEVRLEPYFPLSNEERRFGRFFGESQIAIMSEGKEKRKTWGVDNMQALVDSLGGRFHFVQIGTPADAPLRGALDKRGGLSLRQVAATLHNSDVFVGGIGALMHLARGVACPAVITYSLSEPLGVDSYPCNANVLPVAACNHCQSELLAEGQECTEHFSCIRNITLEAVVAAVETFMQRKNRVVDLAPGVPAPLNPLTARIFSLSQSKTITRKL